MLEAVMIPGYRPRIVLPEPPADDPTWRVLLSLPGRVAIIDAQAAADLMKLARTTFTAHLDDERAAA
jgi:hypothetical protein